MLVESKTDYSGFQQQWKAVNSEQQIEEIASLSLETKHIPDPYWFLITKDGFYSPSAKCFIKDVIKTDTKIGKLEREALLRWEQLVNEDSDDVHVWISPPAKDQPEEYPDTKITVSEVVDRDGVKVLFHRAILVDLSEEEAIRLAQELSRFGRERWDYKNTDEVRSRVLSLKKLPFHWSYLLEEYVDLQGQGEMIRSGQDLLEKEKALSQAREFQPKLQAGLSVEGEMRSRGMIGEFDPSCPKTLGLKPGQQATAFMFMYQHARTIDKDDINREDESNPYYCKNCGSCGKKLNWVVLPGEKCPDRLRGKPSQSCGAVRECA